MDSAADEWSIRDPDFSAQVVEADRLELWLSGCADRSTRERLEALIDRLHHRITEAGTRAVVVDLRQLEFMSAAAFNGLVGWLARLSELPPERRYRIRFRSNPSIRWQQRSLGALSCFATDLVAIET